MQTVNSNNKRLLEIFLELVQLASPTGKVQQFQKLLQAFFESQGFIGGLDEKDNLIFRTKEFDRTKSLLITTHIDTVSPGENIKPKVKGDFVVTDGNTILGADPKSGIAAVMFLIETLNSSGKQLQNLELVFSTNEEEGDHTLAYAEVQSQKALVLDNAASIEKVLYKSPYAQVFEILVEGKEVYAQLDYNKGANAIAALAKIVDSTSWGFYKEGCVANTGVISGGKSTTTVAKDAYLKGNIYCFEKVDIEEFINRLEAVSRTADREFGTKAKVKVVERYCAAIADQEGEFVNKLKKVYLKKGVELELEEQLLVSSNNCLAEKGIESVNLGLGYYHCHTVEERLSIAQFEKFAEVLAEIFYDFKLVK